MAINTLSPILPLGRNKNSLFLSTTEHTPNSAHIAPLIILSAALGTVDTLLGNGVADGLAEAAFAELTANGLVDAVLELVHAFDVGDFGVVKLLCRSNIISYVRIRWS